MGNASVIGPSTPYIIGGDPSQVQHVQNFATALMVSLAQAHGYNVTAAIDMAQNNTAFSGSEAAAIGLVTGMAQSLSDFLTKVGLNGVPVTPFEQPLYDRFLSFLSDPTVDGLFILIGIIALVLDLFHRTLFFSVVAVIFIAPVLLGTRIIGGSVGGIMILISAAAPLIRTIAVHRPPSPTSAGPEAGRTRSPSPCRADRSRRSPTFPRWRRLLRHWQLVQVRCFRPVSLTLSGSTAVTMTGSPQAMSS